LLGFYCFALFLSGGAYRVTNNARLGELREFCERKTAEMLDNKITVGSANVGIELKLLKQCRNTYRQETGKPKDINAVGIAL
jgi:hypothetical protein